MTIVESNDVLIGLFLDDLTKLTKQYGILIHGCGCCNSPSLTFFRGQTIENQQGKWVKGWDEENCKYVFQRGEGAGTAEIAFQVVGEEV